ncbi:hypothetical protein [Halobacterium wangiae]|uniref:hypothetical protein n=1 Tax=Halobacterium wangiae TaxID=2902623 RepID=UPI001E2C8E11|nr:hypothetical protein [Halobacterium wangiae]
MSVSDCGGNDADARGVSQHPGRIPQSYPWADLFEDSRREVRIAALRRIVEADGYGVRFSALVKHLYDHDAIRNSTYDYNRLKDFTDALARHDVVRIERIGPQERPWNRPRWVFPTAEAFQAFELLDDAEKFNTASKQSPPTRDGADTEESAAEPASESLANARGRLKRREALDTAEDYEGLLGDWAAKRLGHERGPAEVRTDSKYNTLSRALATRDRVLDSFAAAAEAGVLEAAVVTLTTAEGWCGSLYEAAESLPKDVDLFKGKVKRVLDLPGRPPVLWVLDVSARGLPHVHVVVFGVDAAALVEHRADLKDYWATHRGRGHQVEVQPLRATATGPGASSEAWTWADAAPEDADGCSPAAYLAKGANALASAADLDAGERRAMADAHGALGDVEVEPGRGPDLPVDVTGVEGVDVHPAAARVGALFWALPCTRVVPKPSWADAPDSVPAIRGASDPAVLAAVDDTVTEHVDESPVEGEVVVVDAPVCEVVVSAVGGGFGVRATVVARGKPPPVVRG